MPDAFGSFFVPGPTEVRPTVLQAMLRPMIAHRGTAYEALHARVVAGLQHVFRTRRPVYVMTASATAMMEASIRAAPVGPVLALVNGAFSQRFARIAQSCDRRARLLEVPWGRAHDPAMVERALADERFAAVLVVHVETSTGAVNDVRTIARLAHAAGAVCLVDAVTSVGGMPVETDAWDLDLAFTGSQKALAMPPGLAFGVASESFILAAPSTPARGRYLDLVAFEEFALRSQVPHTPALSLVYAAEAQLEAILAEGLEARWARHAAMLAQVEAWAADCRRDGIAIDHLAAPGTRATTVSTLTIPEGLDAKEIVHRVGLRGFTIATGYGEMRDTTLRVGHMGEHSVHTLAPCLSAIRESVADALR